MHFLLVFSLPMLDANGIQISIILIFCKKMTVTLTNFAHLPRLLLPTTFLPGVSVFPFQISCNKPETERTRQVSSMTHSARPTVSPVATIVFCCFVLLDLKSGDGRQYGRTNGRTTCAKTMITTGRDCGLAEWIKILDNRHNRLSN